MWAEVSHFWAEVSHTPNMFLMIQPLLEQVLNHSVNLTHMIGNIKLENRG
jgi:hypothetical protein